MKLSKGTKLFILGAVLVVLDQIIKVLVKTNMSLGESIPVFGDWFKILFVENNGMAFGMEFFDKTFLTLFRLVAVLFLIWLLRAMLKGDKYPTGFIVCVALILAGAAGNMIDCLFYGEIFTSSYNRVAELVPFGTGYGSFLHGRVVDMFYFPLFDYQLPWMDYPRTFFGAVFNFADSCVTCGAIYLLLFQYKYFSKEEVK